MGNGDNAPDTIEYYAATEAYSPDLDYDPGTHDSDRCNIDASVCPGCAQEV